MEYTNSIGVGDIRNLKVEGIYNRSLIDTIYIAAPKTMNAVDLQRGCQGKFTRVYS